MRQRLSDEDECASIGEGTVVFGKGGRDGGGVGVFRVWGGGGGVVKFGA